MSEQVLFFAVYPLAAGQKLHIADGPRKGDWEVVKAGEKKVTLRCPVSGVQVEWARFCYFIEEKEASWPVRE